MKSLSQIWSEMQTKLQSQAQSNAVKSGTGFGYNAGNYDFTDYKPSAPQRSSASTATTSEPTYPTITGGDADLSNFRRPPGPQVLTTAGNPDNVSNVDAVVPGWSKPAEGSFLDKATHAAVFALDKIAGALPLGGLLRTTDDPEQQAMMDHYGMRRPSISDMPSMIFGPPIPGLGMILKPSMTGLQMALERAGVIKSPKEAMKEAQMRDFMKYPSRFGDPPAMSRFSDVSESMQDAQNSLRGAVLGDFGFNGQTGQVGFGGTMAGPLGGAASLSGAPSPSAGLNGMIGTTASVAQAALADAMAQAAASMGFGSTFGESTGSSATNTGSPTQGSAATDDGDGDGSTGGNVN